MSADEHEAAMVDDRSAAVDSRLRRAVADARRSVSATGGVDSDTLVTTVRSRRSASGRSIAGHAHRRSRWITIGVPSAAAVVVLVTLWALAASRTPTRHVTSSATCLMSVTFDGSNFRPASRQHVSFAVAERLGAGEIPPCNDTGVDVTSESGEPVEVYRVEGLEPRDGIAVAGLGGAGSFRLFGAFASHGSAAFTAGFQRFLDAHLQSSSSIAASSSPSQPPPDRSDPGSITDEAPTTVAAAGDGATADQ